MRFSRLVEAVEVQEQSHFEDVTVSGISTDSRTTAEGDLYIAVRGHSADGHDFLAQAVRRGAAALVVDRPVAFDLPTIMVADTASAAALIARKFFGDPDAGLVLIGVTGTNGKTSTSFLLQSILAGVYGKTGIIGTVGFGSTDELVAAAHTTPASADLYRILADFAAKGCRAVVMEVSSHATVQRRITGLEFDIGIFTNITRDHLDYHGTIEAYTAAKEMLAESLLLPERRKAPGTLVYNADDALVSSIAARFRGRKISYGMGAGPDVFADRLEADLHQTAFELVIGRERAPINLQLLGSFSAYNALAAASAAHGMGMNLDQIRAGLEAVREVPGRFQVIKRPGGPVVIVDYAHTPDALENLLTFCRELKPERIITVFGCGGDRDRGKRPLMGDIAERLSDVVFITDDNPRTEDPDAIVGEVMRGIPEKSTTVRVQRDRRAAILNAVRLGRTGDLIVVAGKGHERVQIVGEAQIPFSDVEEARAALTRVEVDHQG